MNSDLDNYGNDASYSTLPKIPPSVPQAPLVRVELPSVQQTHTGPRGGAFRAVVQVLQEAKDSETMELYPLGSDPEGRN